MKKNSEKTKFNLKDFLAKNKKNILIYGGIFLLIIVSILLIKFFILDNNKFASVKYQVYTNGQTTSFKKDGGIIESKTPIKGIKLIRNGNFDGIVYYDISNEFENKRCYEDEMCTLEQNIEQISFDMTDTLKKRYDIFYRVYFSNKWSEWSSNSTTVGEKGKIITKIQIRLVPKNAYLGDYLDGYEVINNEK